MRSATAALINELVEAKRQLQLGRALARWTRYDLIAIDVVGYLPLAEMGAEFLFQVVAERAEKASVIVTTNLPFSEGTQVIPTPGDARPCSTGNISSRPTLSPTFPPKPSNNTAAGGSAANVIAPPAEKKGN